MSNKQDSVDLKDLSTEEGGTVFLGKLISRRTDEFKKAFNTKLPVHIQKHCEMLFEDWKSDPSSVAIVPLTEISDKRHEIFKVKLHHKFRALCFKIDNPNPDLNKNAAQKALVWFWCGAHEDYNKIVCHKNVANLRKKVIACEEQLVGKIFKR